MGGFGPADEARTFVPRRVLVAGATGLVGRALLEILRVDPTVCDLHVMLRHGGRSPVAADRDDTHWLRPVIEHRLPDPVRGTSSGQRDADWCDMPTVDDVYICLGTTIRVAGSPEAFRAVDLELVVTIARQARRLGAQRLAVVSAMGADARSSILYNRVKGEMEAALATLGYTCLLIARPSLLDGNRAATGQPPRTGERLALALTRPLRALLPARVRPIDAVVVARALNVGLQAATPGRTVLDSAALQQLGRDADAAALR